MRTYEVKTVIRLTEEQHERLKDITKRANWKGCDWNEKEALEFLAMIRCPDFWDIQLNLFEHIVQEI